MLVSYANVDLPAAGSTLNKSSPMPHDPHSARTSLFRCYVRATVWLPAATLALIMFSASSHALSPLTEVSGITAGHAHTCATLENHTVRCWGANNAGQLGNGTHADSALPVVVYGLSDARAVFASGDSTCAVHVSGNVSCWGSATLGPHRDGTAVDVTVPTSLPALVGVKSVAIGYDHRCVLRDTGQVTCWGTNSNGALGDGTETESRVPVAVAGLTGIVAITAAASYSCALAASGIVSCWGSDLMRPRSTDFYFEKNLVATAVPGLTDATAIAGGPMHMCALRRGGTVTCWGDDRYGRVGIGTRSTWGLLVDVAGVRDAATISSQCAVTGEGAAVCWGEAYHVPEMIFGSVLAVDAASARLVSGVGGATAIASGDKHACARLGNGRINCWGNSPYGQVGNAVSRSVTTPIPVNGLMRGVGLSVSASDNTCAVLDTGSVTCWGANISGQLGIGKLSASSGPTVIDGLAEVTAVATAGAAYAGFSCALRRSGTVACWGSNQWTPGAQGPRPIATPGEILGVRGAIAISMGGTTACVLLADGTVKCWSNAVGSSGFVNGTAASSYEAFGITALRDVKQITVGQSGGHICALLNNQTVVCAGYNNFGQLGNADADGGITPPLHVTNLTNVVAISAGGGHTCAVRADGGVWCWGAADDGQTGIPYHSGVPAKVDGLMPALSVSAGEYHTCAVLIGAEVSCWGRRLYGRLGDGRADLSFSHIPSAVEISDVVSIAAGRQHTCALLGNGSARCWGDNSSGQTGSVQSVFMDSAQTVLSAGPRGAGKTMTEFHYAPLDYYFMTSRDSDKALLDCQPNWSRTGESFTALADDGDQATGLTRFYFDQVARGGTRGSHFYTLLDSERATLHALNRSNASLPRKPVDEAIDGFAYAPLLAGIGAQSCAAGLLPVYRAFRGNARFPDDPNHRFTTDLNLYQSLLAQGWDGEGVKFCVPK